MRHIKIAFLAILRTKKKIKKDGSEYPVYRHPRFPVSRISHGDVSKETGKEG